jgi:hypothetical protein
MWGLWIIRSLHFIDLVYSSLETSRGLYFWPPQTEAALTNVNTYVFVKYKLTLLLGGAGHAADRRGRGHHRDAQGEGLCTSQI